MGWGGFASPFSELTLDNSKDKGIYDMIEKGQLRYIRSGTRTRREGLLFAATQYFNYYLHSPLLFRLLNRRFVFNTLRVPFIPSVAIHHDTTVSMVKRLVQSMSDCQSVVFCMHGILRLGDNDYNNRFNWDYDRFEAFLQFLKSDKRYRVITSEQLVSEIYNK